jgi:hypothetical protein
VDAKSVKNTDTAGEKGDDAGKKIAGVKPRLAVDTGGLPHALKVIRADVTDREGAVEALRAIVQNLSKGAKALCDGGYTGENFAEAVKALPGPGRGSGGDKTQ